MAKKAAAVGAAHTPYPEDFPSECISALIGHLMKRQELDVPTLAHHAWEVMGYGLKVGLGEGRMPVGAAGEIASLSDEELGKKLEEATAVKGDVGAIPWPLIMIALEIFKRFILK
jgi:hypothetical protein